MTNGRRLLGERLLGERLLGEQDLIISLTIKNIFDPFQSKKPDPSNVFIFKHFLTFFTTYFVTSRHGLSIGV